MATETPGVSTEVIDLTQDRIPTYAAYYNSAQADAYQGSYTGLMNAYKVDDSLQVEGQRRARQSLWSSILQTRDVAQSLLTMLPRTIRYSCPARFRWKAIYAGNTRLAK